MPVVTDQESWIIQLMEHRRALLELVIATFPAELQNKKSLIDVWRLRLRINY
jgi:hypothetical protein